MHERIEALETEADALRESAERFRILFELAPDPYCFTELDGTLVDVNEAAVRLTGYDRNELVGSNFLRLDLLPPTQVPRAEKLLSLDPLGKPRGPTPFTLVRRDGRSVEVEITTVPVEIGGRVGVLAIARDVTDRTRMTDGLRESEERYQRAARAGRVGVWEWDLRTNAMYLDPELKTLLGYEEGEIRNHMDDWSRHVHPDDVDKVGAAVEPCLEGSASTFDVEHRMVHKDGSTLWFLGRGTVIRDDRGEPIRMVGSDVDVTEHKKAEEERGRLESEMRLLQSQKLESLGVLAGGVAHDFNNMLTTILGNASLALSKLDSGADVRELIERIEKGALRASELTNQLLAYSGKGRFQVGPVRLNDLVSEMVPLLEMSVSKKAELRLELAAEDPVIEADASQIRQVIMNLVLNASDSVQSAGGGVVTISTDSVRHESPPTTLPAPQAPPPARHAVLQVTDTGRGMDRETMARVFEPFFTTKERGRGLGLAAVQGIVRGHGGHVELETRVGAGTSLRVLFPRTSERPQPPEPEAPMRAGSRGRRPTVLVVDDEVSVRDVAVQILADDGFTVVTAQNGVEAVDRFRERSEEISIALLDLTMPDIDGDVVLERLRSIREGVPVVLMSGFDEQRSIDRLRGATANDFLKKPFRAKELLSTIHRCLNGVI